MQSLFGPADELPNASLSSGGKKGEGEWYFLFMRHFFCRVLYRTSCGRISDRELCLFLCILLYFNLPFFSGKDGLESGEDGHDGNEANPYPETEIDDMRAVRDAALARYIQVRGMCESWLCD